MVRHLASLLLHADSQAHPYQTLVHDQLVVVQQLSDDLRVMHMIASDSDQPEADRPTAH